jgi:Putative beta-barrel porin-2, OmpL-like. bbp2
MRTNTCTKRRSVLIAGLLAGLASQVGLQTAKAQQAPEPASQNESATTDSGGAVTPAPTEAPTPDAPADPQAPAAAATPATPPPVDLDTPFAFGDFTWMNAVPRNHDSVFDGKYYTGEFRWDSNFIEDFNHPIDHSLGGTTEGTRTGEFVLQQMNVGGDFHWEGVQARFLSQLGAVATATPRNDASNTEGQWDTADAYRYFTEGYGGYHINYKHGLNIQAGIFMSFIGLFSYYTFDNWGYQPSYVSSNTPWFFNGFRAQFFPTNKLKFEPWLINGWQSYAKYNGRVGVGGQILWRPSDRWDFVFNSYTAGEDTPYTHRMRSHEDDSFEYKEYENPNHLMHRAAMSFTFDIGCESGGGGAPIVQGTTQLPKVVCTHGSNATPAQNFIGGMMYQRFWFGHDHFGATVGGGWVNNPGRYLVLLPPIDGATATTGTPYFTENPGQSFKAYDYQATFDYMPTQFVTWRVEFTERGANVPYFAGSGGMTPPGGNNGSPALYTCINGMTSATTGGCGGNGGLWQPDLRKEEKRITFALLVRL